MKTIMLTVE